MRPPKSVTRLAVAVVIVALLDMALLFIFASIGAFVTASLAFLFGYVVCALLNGMTLRDWFAGMAMVGVLSCPATPRATDDETIAAWSYFTADAMLAERAKK